MPFQPSANVKTGTFKDSSKKSLIKQNLNSIIRDAMNFEKQLIEIGDNYNAKKMQNVASIVKDVIDDLNR